MDSACLPRRERKYCGGHLQVSPLDLNRLTSIASRLPPTSFPAPLVIMQRRVLSKATRNLRALRSVVPTAAIPAAPFPCLDYRHPNQTPCTPSLMDNTCSEKPVCGSCALRSHMRLVRMIWLWCETDLFPVRRFATDVVGPKCMKMKRRTPQL